MTKGSAKRKVTTAQGLARLLTLLCFFHFAGMNNGYTAMMASAPQPLQSTAAVAGLAQSAFSIVQAPALRTIRSGQKLLSSAVFEALEFHAFIFAAAAEILPDISDALRAAAQEQEEASLLSDPSDAGTLRRSVDLAGGWTRLVSLKQEYGLKTELGTAAEDRSASPRIGRLNIRTLLSRLEPLRAVCSSERFGARRAQTAQKIIHSNEQDGDAPSSHFSSTLFVSPSQDRSEASIRAVVFLG